MLRVILLFVYMYGSPAELKIEQTPYPTEEECKIAGGRRAAELVKDPKFIEGYIAACIPANVTEAKK